MTARVPLAWRLFLAQLVAITLVAVIGVELVRWRFFDNFAPSSAESDLRRLAALEPVIADAFREHHDWSFLPAADHARRAWLREAFVRVDPDRGGVPSLEHRIGLFDAHHQLIAGVSSSRWLLAVASLDRTERTLTVDGARVGSLVVARPQNPADGLAVAFLLDQQQNILFVVAVSVMLSALAAAMLAERFRRPIEALVNGARRLEQAAYGTRVNLDRRDELGELASAFNHLAQKLEQSEQARRQWVADTSHELRTPLAVLKANLEAVQDGIRAHSPEHVALLLKHVEALGTVVDQLAEFARADVGQLTLDRRPLDAWALTRELFEGFGPRFAAAGLTPRLEGSPARSMIEGDANRLRRVFLNLFENAARYTAAGGTVVVAASSRGGTLELSIDDSAPGVPTEVLGRLGERFFRLEATREHGGMGLGLALARLLVEGHGGSLRFAASALGGLRVIIVLPLREP